jgi:PST family polysaccharide transporter
VSGTLIALAALPASLVWHSSTLPSLLLTLAIAAPFQALAVLPEALLHNRLQFRLLAAIGVLGVAAQMLLSIVLAYLGFGAMSFALPIPLGSAFRTIALWVAAPFPIRLRVVRSWRRWSLLFRDGAVVFATNICAVIVSQGDYAVLGTLVSHEDLGLYFLAFSMSVAPLHLFAQTLNSALFPALSLLQSDCERQVNAGLQATRVLAIITIPVSLIQAATAKPIVALILDKKWSSATPILTILCLGMVWRATGWPSASLLQAQGRFRERFYISLTWAVLLPSLIGIAGWLGGILYASAATAVFYSIVGPITIYITFRPHGLGAREILEIYAAPTLVGLVAVGIAWTVSQWIVGPWQQLLQIGTMVIVSLAIYLPGIYLAEPQIVLQVIGRLWPRNIIVNQQPV